MPVRRAFAVISLAAAAGLTATACSASSASTNSSDPVVAVGAENEYANVISQIGGKYVSVTAIESNPNTDPHEFEASPVDASEVSKAQLIVQNGVGYDTYMNKIESSSPSSSRKIIDVQTLRGLPNSTPNPHLWYSPETMPAVAKAVGDDLAALRPSHAAYFRANVAKFDASLKPWLSAIAAFKAAYAGTPVAVTEPVGDYMLQVDPSPQYVSLEDSLFSQHKVKVFVYNQQVTDSLTASFLAAAKKYGIPVVGVYETMPVPGYNYQSWMLAEVNALRKAVADKVSTEKL